MRPHCRGAMRPSFALLAALEKKEGAGKAGCALHQRSRAQLAHRKRTRAYRFSGNTPAFPAQWFYGLFRALPGERALLPPSSPRSFASRKLDASVAASGPHDFAVRAACDRLSQAARPPHPTARFVTIASRPSHRVRQAELNTDLPLREERNIFILGLDINSENQKYCPSGCFVAAGSRDFACARGDAVRSA